MQNVKEKLQNLSVAELVSYSVAGLALFIGVVTLVVTIGKSGSYKNAVFNLESQKSQLAGKLGQGISQELDDTGDAGNTDTLTDEQIAAGETGSVAAEDGARRFGRCRRFGAAGGYYGGEPAESVFDAQRGPKHGED